MPKSDIKPFNPECRCGGVAEREVRFDDMLDSMYHRYVCPRCKRKTGKHLTRWEAQEEWEEINADSGR